MNSAAPKIYEIFNHLLNQSVKQTKLGHGSFLTIGFGPDIQIEVTKRGKKETKLRPEWYLWTYMCSWELSINHTVITSKDDRDTIEHALVSLEDKKLLRVTVLDDLLNLKLEFEGPIVLSLFSDNSEDDNIQWRLYTPEKKVLVAGPFDQISYSTSSSA